MRSGILGRSTASTVEDHLVRLRRIGWIALLAIGVALALGFLLAAGTGVADGNGAGIGESVEAGGADVLDVPDAGAVESSEAGAVRTPFAGTFGTTNARGTTAVATTSVPAGRIAVAAGTSMVTSAPLATASASSSASAPSSVPSSAPASAPSSANPCSGVDDPAVVATVGGTDSYGPGDDLALYVGTEFVVEACGSGVRLDATDVDGLTVESGSNQRLALRTDGPVRLADERQSADGEFHLGTLAGVQGPNVTVAGAVVETSLVDGSLATPSATRANAFVDAEETYLDRERALREALEALADATTELESGSDVDGTRLDETTAAHDAYRESVEELRIQLFLVAASDVGSARTTAAFAALDAQEGEVDERIHAAVGDHEAALADRDRSVTWALRLRVLGIGAVGILVGAVLGGALPFRRGRAADTQLRRGEWVTYSRTLALRPAIVGAIVLAVGLGLLAIEVGWVLLEVIA